jgi:POT family proton-dependent oligopeptide transporter
MIRRLATLRTGFSRTFWIANTLELFERLAFYGTKAVLAVFLANKVGLGVQVAGALVGLFSGVLYSLPILAGVFVDRFGFRKSLASCFFFFFAGYFLIGLAGMEAGQSLVTAVGKVGYVTVVLLLTGVGGSLIKPCIVGTVARTSRPDARPLGFSIYYSLVNLGGAIGPNLALGVREHFGIEYVLVMASLTSLLLMLGALLFFHEPESHDGSVVATSSFKKVFADMLLVFRNLRFISFLVIFSGFWIMFWQIFYSFPFYVIEVLRYEHFELLETVDAWTIILVTIPATALVKRLSPIMAMTLGFIIASSSWLLLAASASVAMSILAMALFAVGEATQAPRFYDYVSALAPKEQVGTFMGFAFLPVAIGSFVAGPLSGWLVQRYIRDTLNPPRIWIILATIGFASTLLMILYNLFLAEPKAAKVGEDSSLK